MLVNQDQIKDIDNALKMAIYLIVMFSDVDIRLIPSAGKKKKVSAFYMGANNALSGGRSDYESKSIQRAFDKAQKNPSFPKTVTLKKTELGYLLTLKK